MGHGSERHVTPFSTYLNVFLALVAMTIITVGMAYVHLGKLNTVIAMFIATVKASLVVLFFMHQKYEVTMNRIIFVMGFFFLGLLFFFTALDIWTRDTFTTIGF